MSQVRCCWSSGKLTLKASYHPKLISHAMIIVSFLNCVCSSLAVSNPSHLSNQVPFISLNCCRVSKSLSSMQDQIQQLPQGTVTTKHRLPKICYLCNHHLQYVVVYMSCCCGCSIEWLILYKHLLEYEDIKAGILLVLYLTEEMILFSLFSEIVPAQERQELARTM